MAEGLGPEGQAEEEEVVERQAEEGEAMEGQAVGEEVIEAGEGVE